MSSESETDEFFDAFDTTPQRQSARHVFPNFCGFNFFGKTKILDGKKCKLILTSCAPRIRVLIKSRVCIGNGQSMGVFRPVRQVSFFQ